MSMMTHRDFELSNFEHDETATMHRVNISETAEVLAELSAEIEALGARLCEDPAVVASHMDALQAIDLIAQQQRWLSELLLAKCPIAGVEQIGVDQLRTRMLRAR